MCGIVGYTGKQEAAPIMLEGLKRLEYRGYDSAGLVIADSGTLQVCKQKGYVDELSEKIDGGRLMKGRTGVGHTRWATHGKPSDENAHPHVSYKGDIALVHNGIIENYQQLREMLVSKGVKFQSETDTEVAVNLIQFFYKGDIVKAISEAALRMEGSYALGIVCKDYPEQLFATRKESPLILGVGDGENFLASDVAAVLKYTRDVYYLDDDEIAVVTPHAIKIYSRDLEEVDKAPSRVDWDISAAEKSGYEHFMFKEIMEQPEAVRKTISPRIKDGRIVLDDIQLSRGLYQKTEQNLHCRLRFFLSRRGGGQIQFRKTDAEAGRGGARLRIPLLLPAGRRRYACHLHQPVRHDGGHNRRHAGGQTSRCKGPVHRQRRRQRHCQRIGLGASIPGPVRRLPLQRPRPTAHSLP